MRDERGMSAQYPAARRVFFDLPRLVGKRKKTLSTLLTLSTASSFFAAHPRKWMSLTSFDIVIPFFTEAEHSYFFHDLRLNMFLRRSKVTCFSISLDQCGQNQETYPTALFAECGVATCLRGLLPVIWCRGQIPFNYSVNYCKTTVLHIFILLIL